MISRILLTIAAAAMLTPFMAMESCAQVLEGDSQAAVIVVYHHIGEDDDPATSVRMDQFKAHIRELKDGNYSVRPLPQIIADFRSHTAQPPHALAITFDGGHKSILKDAVPLLLEKNLPFTIFIAPAQLDQNLPDYIGWDDVKRLNKSKLVTFGLHPADYTRLIGKPDVEIKRQINTAKARFREKMGTDATLFAYPFGEYSAHYRDIVEQSGFIAGFGQQSGVASADSDRMTLPRFSVTEGYGDIDRFRMIAEALPLPVSGVEPRDPHLTTATPSIGFTVDPDLKTRLASLSCFVSDQPAPKIHKVGEDRIEIRLAQPLTTDKARINCTVPVSQETPDDPPRWRWWGMLVTAP